jgi:hypothetical protein
METIAVREFRINPGKRFSSAIRSLGLLIGLIGTNACSDPADTLATDIQSPQLRKEISQLRVKVSRLNKKAKKPRQSVISQPCSTSTDSPPPKKQKPYSAGNDTTN